MRARGWAVFLAFLLLTSACGPISSLPSTTPGATAATPPAPASRLPQASPEPPPGPDPIAKSLVDRLRAPAYTSDTTQAAVEALARAGVATVADPSSSVSEVATQGPVSPLRLLEFEAHALAVDAWRGDGLTGAQIDSLLPIPAEIHDQTAPASAFLAAYVAAIDSPGAALGRELMAGQDLTRPDALHFPLIVLTLFSSDLATDGGRHPAARGPGPIGAIAASYVGPGITAGGTDQIAVATLCSDSANFINQTIDSLFNALKLAVPNNTVGAFVASLWNWIVDQGKAFVHTLIKAVTDAVLATVRSIAGGIATITRQVAGLVPYVVTVQPQPGDPIALGNSAMTGEFVATVTGGDLLSWPDVLKDCASQAQVALPGFRGSDERVTWGDPTSLAGGLISPGLADAKTDGQGQAIWRFTIEPDPGEAPGEELRASLKLPITVHRSELDAVRKTLSNSLFGGLPPILHDFADALFKPLLDPIQAEIEKLIDTHGSGAVKLVYHGPPPSVKPTATPNATASGSPTPTSSARRNFSSGTITYTVSGPGSADGSLPLVPQYSFVQGSTIYVTSAGPPSFGGAFAAGGFVGVAAGGTVYVEDPGNPIELEGSGASCTGTITQLDAAAAAGKITCTGLSSAVGRGQDSSDEPNAYSFTITFRGSF